MRIGIHVSAASAAAESYAKGLFQALHNRLPTHHSLTLFDSRRAVSCLPGLCTDRALSRYLRSVDLSHSIGHTLAPAADALIVPMVPDLAALSYGHTHTAEARQLERFLAQIDRYPVVTTLSQHASGQIAALSGFAPARIGVISPGVDALFYEPARPEDDWELQALGLLPRQFFLHVGTHEESANLKVLLIAYAALPERVKAWLPLVLVLSTAGRNTMRHNPLPESAQREVDAGNIRLLDTVPRFLLPVLYRSARLALFPELSTGFDCSLAEALVCGAPVAVSDGTALAEIAGARALLVNPHDAIAWRDAMAAQVDRLSHAVCRCNLADFSWDCVAEQALALYQRARNATCVPA
jgi:alpha-1,3-rhamnosyl/mannosyltransferase